MRTVLLLALLSSVAGCTSGGGAANPPLTPTQSAAAPESRIAPALAKLLYAGGPNTNDVDVYDAGQDNPQPRRHITRALDAPTGMAVDALDNLYVCNNAGQSARGKSVYWTVTVYHRGKNRPFLTYTDGVLAPVDVAVSGGAYPTVYVANITTAVTVYPPNSVHPSKTLKAPMGYDPIGVALDAKDRVFVSYVPQSGSGGLIYTYPPNRARGKDLGIAFPNGSPHGVAVDAQGDLIVAVSNAPGSGSQIEIFAPGKTKPKQILTGPFQPFMVALDRNNKHLFVADYGSGNDDGGVFVYAYPSGKLLFKDTNGAAAGAYGVAID
jgi:sugar lactone lactonase YvrE